MPTQKQKYPEGTGVKNTEAFHVSVALTLTGHQLMLLERSVCFELALADDLSPDGDSVAEEMIFKDEQRILRILREKISGAIKRCDNIAGKMEVKNAANSTQG